MLQVFRSLGERSPNFLAEREWLELPWASTPKDSHDQLLDIMLKAPAIFPKEATKDARTSPQNVLNAAVRRARACWLLDSQLTDWLGRLANEVSGPLFWPEEKTTPDDGAGAEEKNTLFSTVYQFPSFILAQTLVLYWTTRVVVCDQLCAVYRELQAFSATATTSAARASAECTCLENRRAGITSCLVDFTTEGLPALGYREDWTQTVARHICHSVEYFLQDKMRCAGPACLMPPAMVLRWLWQQQHASQGVARDRELRWLDQVLARVHARGNGIAVCV